MIRNCLLCCFLLLAVGNASFAQTDFCSSFYNISNDITNGFERSKGDLIASDTTRNADSTVLTVTSKWKAKTFFHGQSRLGEVTEMSTVSNGETGIQSQNATYYFIETTSEKEADKLFYKLKKEFTQCAVDGWEIVESQNSGSGLISFYTLSRYRNNVREKRVELLFTYDGGNKLPYTVKVVFGK